MSKYYDKNSGQEVSAKKVVKPHETFESNGIEILVSKGNYAVTMPDGRLVGFAAEDFDQRFTTSKKQAEAALKETE